MILFICHGNVARSQFAAALYRARTGHEAASAGTHVRPEKTGAVLIDDGEAARRAVSHFKRITGIDISVMQRKPLTRDLAEKADRIIVLTKREDVPEWLFQYKKNIDFWDVADPHDMDFEDYRKTTEIIQEKVTRLADETVTGQ
jgi:protein-tyrosine-phosphatase